LIRCLEGMYLIITHIFMSNLCSTSVRFFINLNLQYFYSSTNTMASNLNSFEYFLGAAIFYPKLRLLCLNLGSRIYSTRSNLDDGFWVSTLQNTFSEASKPVMTSEEHFVGSDSLVQKNLLKIALSL
jgi:hypothetical protein